MILSHRRVHGAQVDASLLKRCSGSQTREKFRHAMGTLGDHRRRKMMRAAGDVRDNFGLLWIRDARLKHTDDCGGTFAKLNGLANHRRVSVESVGPETISEDKDTGGLRGVIFRADEPPENRMRTHHVEVGSVDHSAINFSRLAEPDESEGDCGEIAKLVEALDPLLEVPNFRHRPGAVFLVHARSALPDINQLVLVAINQRLDEYASHEREDGGIGTNTQRQCDDHDKRESRRFSELAKSKP